MKRTLVVLAWGASVGAYLALGWIPGVLLLALALLGTLRALVGTARALAPSVVCRNHHRIPTYGLVRCGACGFVEEGSIWSCSYCGARFGHTPCPECGLSVPNPSL